MGVRVRLQVRGIFNVVNCRFAVGVNDAVVAENACDDDGEEFSIVRSRQLNRVEKKFVRMYTIWFVGERGRDEDYASFASGTYRGG